MYRQWKYIKDRRNRHLSEKSLNESIDNSNTSNKQELLLVLEDITADCMICRTDEASPDMKMAWETTAPNEEIFIYGRVEVAGITNLNKYYDFEIDWGDGTVETYQGVKDISHIYANAGVHDVVISGQYGGMYLGTNPTNSAKLVEFSNWGDSYIAAIKYMFANSTNLDYTATDTPTFGEPTENLKLLSTDARHLFYASGVTNLDLSNWDWHRITYFYYGFRSCANLESITINNITINAYNYVYFLSNCGNNTANGTIVNFNNWTIEAASTISVSHFLSGSKINYANMKNWHLNQPITGSYFVATGVGSDASRPENIIDLSGWTTTSTGWTSLASWIRGGHFHTLDTTGWPPEMTENCSSWSHFGYAAKIRKWEGLNSIRGNSCTSFQNAFSYCQHLSFTSPTSNFSDDFDIPSATNLTYFFGFVGSNLTIDEHLLADPPNCTNWDFTSVQNANGVFYTSHFNDVPDTSQWVMPAVTTLTNFVYNFSLPNSLTEGGGILDLSSSNLTSSFTQLVNFCRGSAIKEVNFGTTGDWSGVTSFSHAFYAPQIPAAEKNDFKLTLPNNINLGSVSTFTNGFTNLALNTDDYDYLLTRLEATNALTSVVLYAGSSKYTGDSIFSDMNTRMTDWTISNKVIDTNQDFVALGIVAGNIVRIKYGSTVYYSKILSVDSPTELTIDQNIVTSTYSYYNIERSAVSLARYDLDITQSWVITDGGST